MYVFINAFNLCDVYFSVCVLYTAQLWGPLNYYQLRTTIWLWRYSCTKINLSINYTQEESVVVVALCTLLLLLQKWQ